MPRWVGVPMGRSRALLCLALLAESDSTACGPSGATHREVSFPNCPLAIGIVDHQLPNETTVQPWCLTFFWQLSMVHGSNMRWVLTVAKSTFSTLPCHLQLLNLRTSGIDKSWPWPHLGARYQIPKSLWWGTIWYYDPCENHDLSCSLAMFNAPKSIELRPHDTPGTSKMETPKNRETTMGRSSYNSIFRVPCGFGKCRGNCGWIPQFLLRKSQVWLVIHWYRNLLWPFLMGGSNSPGMESQR